MDEELDGLSADVVIDLSGAPAVPGFNDAHHHLSMRGQRLRELDLRVATLDELYAKVAERAAGLPEGAWVRGAGYDQNKLGAHPTREALDRAAGGRSGCSTTPGTWAWPAPRERRAVQPGRGAHG